MILLYFQQDHQIIHHLNTLHMGIMVILHLIPIITMVDILLDSILQVDIRIIPAIRLMVIKILTLLTPILPMWLPQQFLKLLEVRTVLILLQIQVLPTHPIIQLR